MAQLHTNLKIELNPLHTSLLVILKSFLDILCFGLKKFQVSYVKHVSSKGLVKKIFFIKNTIPGHILKK